MRIRLLTPLLLLPLLLGCVTIERPLDTVPALPDDNFEGAAWPDTPIPYCLVPADGFVSQDRFASAVRDAFTQWDIDVQYTGTCEAAIADNSRNEITWGYPPDRGIAFHESGYTRLRIERCISGCPAGARPYIAEADVFIHPDPPSRLRNEGCLLATLLHETGHFLGMPHLEPPAIMAPVTNTCPKTLTDADRAAAAALYGSSD